MILHNNLNDFILFLYVHMSEADSSYDPKEIAVIKTKMAGLFSEGVDFEQKLYTTLREYNTFDKANLNQLINDSFSHFENSDATRNKLINDLQEIVNADGKIDPAEGKAFNVLKEMIDHLS